MMTLIAAALAAAAPAASTADAHAQHQHQGQTGQQMMADCKKCCEEMKAKHADVSDRGKHSHE